MRSIFFICFLLIAKTGFCFDVNVSERDITRFKYKFIIDDLVVGDTAYVNYLDFCTENEKLMIMKHGAIGEKNELFPNFLISVEPAIIASWMLATSFRILCMDSTLSVISSSRRTSSLRKSCLTELIIPDANAVASFNEVLAALS